MRIYRESNGLTILDFADILEISSGSLSDIENNKTKPSARPLAALIQKTDINVYWLFSGEGEPCRKGRRGEGGEPEEVGPPAQEETTIYKDREEEPLVMAGETVYNKDSPAGPPKGDPLRELLEMTAEILASHTDYAASLAANIRSFHKSVELEKRTSSLEQKCDELIEEVMDLKKSVVARSQPQEEIEKEEEEAALPEAANRK